VFDKTGFRSRLKRAGPIAAVAALALALVPSASSGNYGDPSGDSSVAPDITGLTVASDKASGLLTFQIAESNAAAPNSITELDVDSDANPVTGDLASRGADYAVQVNPSKHSFGFWHWNGSAWVSAPATTVRVLPTSAGFLISVNKSEVGNAADVNFGAVTFMLDGPATDSAPDDGLWNYSIDTNGPNILSAQVATKPSSGPKAGKLFTVTPTGLTLPPSGRVSPTALLPDSYTCTAKLGTRTLVGAATGGCTFKLPKKKARGKTLTVQLTVSYEGAAKVVPLRFKVG
jgi:hypothetical protein